MFIKIPSAKSLWESLRSSLWFLPAIIIIVSIVLALALVEIDSGVDAHRLGQQWPRLFGAGAEGARGMLSAIAGSMITVAGVAFSITIVALALASSQYTSRILRNFMRDRANQAVLGIQTGVFTYCIVVLRTIRSGDEVTFVPSLAVLFAVVLALFGISSLIFFIHHIASSIQAELIIKAAADETFAAVDRLFPGEIGDQVNALELEFEQPETRHLVYDVPAKQTGYIQGVDEKGLLELAREKDVVIRMQRGIGEFVAEGGLLLSLEGGQVPSEDTQDLAEGLFDIGSQRTMVQDASFGIRQIVDVALKALSPGVNDTTTAVNCIDYLGAIVSRLATRQMASPLRKEDGVLRVIARGPTFAGMVGLAFDQIRQNADGNVAILESLLQTLEMILRRNTFAAHRPVLKRQVEMIGKVARRSIPTEEDLHTIEQLLRDLSTI